MRPFQRSRHFLDNHSTEHAVPPSNPPFLTLFPVISHPSAAHLNARSSATVPSMTVPGLCPSAETRLRYDPLFWCACHRPNAHRLPPYDLSTPTVSSCFRRSLSPIRSKSSHLLPQRSVGLRNDMSCVGHSRIHPLTRFGHRLTARIIPRWVPTRYLASLFPL